MRMIVCKRNTRPTSDLTVAVLRGSILGFVEVEYYEQARELYGKDDIFFMPWDNFGGENAQRLAEEKGVYTKPPPQEGS